MTGGFMRDKERHEMTDEEEAKLAQSGAWIALLLLPLVLLCICGVFAATPRGRVGLYELILQYSKDGAPYMENISYVRGFVGAARAGCKLNRQSPQQESLGKEYEAMVKLYKNYWGNFKSAGGDTENYPPPSDIPDDLFSGGLQYCR